MAWSDTSKLAQKIPFICATTLCARNYTYVAPERSKVLFRLGNRSCDSRHVDDAPPAAILVHRGWFDEQSANYGGSLVPAAFRGCAGRLARGEQRSLRDLRGRK